jgi:hypothetical protein
MPGSSSTGCSSTVLPSATRRWMSWTGIRPSLSFDGRLDRGQRHALGAVAEQRQVAALGGEEAAAEILGGDVRPRGGGRKPGGSKPQKTAGVFPRRRCIGCLPAQASRRSAPAPAAARVQKTSFRRWELLSEEFRRSLQTSLLPLPRSVRARCGPTSRRPPSLPVGNSLRPASSIGRGRIVWRRRLLVRGACLVRMLSTRGPVCSPKAGHLPAEVDQ